jgi:DNA replication protein DnaC
MEIDDLQKRLSALGFLGIHSYWAHIAANHEIWQRIATAEEQARQDKIIDARLATAKIGRFVPMAKFDWKWPKIIPRNTIEELLTLAFMADRGNAILIGPNGVGKTMIAQNLAHSAVIRGKTALFCNAGALLNDLSSATESHILERKLRRYSRFDLLVIDELGYLSYATRHGDLLFQLIERRHEERSTVVTTNKPFSEWNTLFPNSACVTALIDRLVQYGEIAVIDGDSYRLKQANERKEQKHKKRTEPAPENIPF